MRLAPPGIPGKWTDAATNEHGDLLDLIRLHTGGASLRHAMEEALAFLVIAGSTTPANGGNRAGGYDREEAARRLWRRCRPIDGTHAEAYLHARAIGHCRFPALRFHPDLIYRSEMTASTECRHWSPPSPAMMAPSRVCSGPGLTPSDPKKPTSPARAKRLGASTAAPCDSAGLPPARPCLPARASKPCYLVVTAVPGIHAAAALSAGSLGAFETPQDLSLLVIARDKDVEGGHAANRLQLRCVERGIPSTVIVPEHSDFNDDLIAIGEETLAARIATLIASSKSAATAEERCRSGRIISPVVMSHCLTVEVEDWRASLRVRWLFRRFRSGPQSGSHGHVSSPRSSNRTCGFPASGFRTRSCLRTRKAQCVPRQTGEAVFFV